MPTLLKRYLPFLIYSLTAFAIAVPLFRHGYIFLLDFVMGPEIQLSDSLQNGIGPSFLWILIFKLLSFVISVAIIQKVLLTMLLIAIGLSMYTLARYVMPRNWSILSGLIYLLNPYVYERFLGGQWFVLAGYAFFPIMVRHFLELLEKPNKRKFFIFACLFAIYPLMSQHWAYLATIFLVALGVVDLILHRKSIRLTLAMYRGLAMIILLFLAVNSFWLFHFFSRQSSFSSFSLNDFEAFKTVGDAKWGVYFNVLSLYGFWIREYFLPKDFFSYWWVITFLMLTFSIIGLYRMVKERSSLGITLGFLFIPILLIAVGDSSPVTMPLVSFLYHAVPGFKGLRETAKVIGLLAFTYAVLVPIGGLMLIRWLKVWLEENQKPLAKYLVFTLILLIPLVMTNSIFVGFSNQIPVADYPQSWYSVNQLLNTDTTTRQVLFLPWHGYLRFPFTHNHLIANPAQVFFHAPIISSSTTHNPFLDNQSQDPWGQHIDRWISHEEPFDGSFSWLTTHHISHIVLAKTEDWKNYTFLSESKKLSRLYESAHIVVYKVE